MSNEVKSNFGVKIGARNLTKAALGELLPEYEQIETEIKHMRDNALNYNECRHNSGSDLWSRLDNEYINNVNNVISILGGRGSGKTSVLLSIKHKLDKGYYNEEEVPKNNDGQLSIERNDTDIIMPTILPETMGENSDLLGWILGGFRTIVERIEQEIKEDRDNFFSEREDIDKYFEQCRLKNNNPLREAYNNVLLQYRYTQKDYQEIIQKEFENFNTYMDDSKNIMDPQNKLILQFHLFIEKIVELIGKKKNRKMKKQPLVFLFIDDADLSCERCEEVLNVIMRYLSHPNIVTFVAGDMEKFKEVLLVNYLNHMNIINVLTPPSFTEAENAKGMLNSYRLLVEDNIKKILPPTLRYMLKEYDYDKRWDFSYDNVKPLSELLNDCFEMEKVKWNLEKTYGILLDRYPRGMMNVYYELFLSSKKILEWKNENVVEHIKNEILGESLEKLIKVIIRSNSLFSTDLEKKILQCISINKKDFQKSWVDFIKAKSMYLEEDSNTSIINLDDSDENKKKSLQQNQLRLSVYTLLNFTENIINKLSTDYRRLHGESIVYECMSESVNKGAFKLLPNCNDINMELEFYQRLVHDIAFEAMKNIKDTSVKHDSYIQYLHIVDSIGEQIASDGLEKNNSENKTTIDNKSKFINYVVKTDYDWANMIFSIINLNRNIVKVVLNYEENSLLDNIQYTTYEFRNLVKGKVESCITGGLVSYCLDNEGKNKKIHEKIKNCKDAQVYILKTINSYNNIKDGNETANSEKIEKLLEKLYVYESEVKRINDEFSRTYEIKYMLGKEEEEAIQNALSHLNNRDLRLQLLNYLRLQTLDVKEYKDLLSIMGKLYRNSPKAIETIYEDAYNLVAKMRKIIMHKGEKLFSTESNEENKSNNKNLNEKDYENYADTCFVYILIKAYFELENADESYFKEFITIHKELSDHCDSYKKYTGVQSEK